MALRSSTSLLLVPLLSLCCASCTSRSFATLPQPAVAKSPTAPPGPGEWANWSHDKKLEYMKAVVVVKEKQLFADYDPVKFNNLECKTCHGSGATDGTYKMPNPELSKWPGGAEPFQKLAAKNPKLLYFMQSVVVPETARMLNVKSFDFSTHTGFSCFHCHTRGPYEGG